MEFPCLAICTRDFELLLPLQTLSFGDYRMKTMMKDENPTLLQYLLGWLCPCEISHELGIESIAPLSAP